jgi:glycosyltransferase involved in cell wall biosynthesis
MNVRDVSVVVTTRNNAGSIRACLESAGGFGETVVVDAFSDDGTADLSRGFPVTIYRRRSRSDAEQRNWALSRATRRWILALEPDDVLTNSLREEIERVDENAAEGFFVRSETEYLGRRMRSRAVTQSELPRLFDRERGKYAQAGGRVGLELDGRAAALGGTLREIPYRDVHAHFEAINRETTLDARASVDGGGGRLALVRMLFHPPLRFLNLYCFRFGIADGSRGLIYCLLSAYAAFIEHAKTWEYRRRKRREIAQERSARK